MPRTTPALVEVTPGYWDDACKHLTRRDRVMKKLIPRFGEARLQSRGDAFTTLARSIVGQQISVKAAQAVWDRFAALSQGLLPQTIVDSLDAARYLQDDEEYWPFEGEDWADEYVGGENLR